MRKISWLILLVFLAACASEDAPILPDYSSKPKHVQICYTAADGLARQLVAKKTPDLRIIKITFVDIDNVESVTSYSKVYPEVIASRLSQLGYSMVELKLRTGSIKITPKTGEMLLSYDQSELAKDYSASAALIGYYKRIPQYNTTMVYARIVNVNDNVIIASEDFSIVD